MKPFFSFICPLLFSMIALARGGTTAGDGGHGVICEAQAQLLDLFEARHLYGSQPELGNIYQNEELYFFSAVQTAELRMVAVLGKDHPFLKVFDRARALLHDERAILLTDHPSLTTDQGEALVALPKGCQAVQLATRKSWGDNWFHFEVNKDTWKRLARIDRAALVLHEAFHEGFSHPQSTLALRQVILFLTASPQFRSCHAETLRQIVESGQAADPKIFQSCH